MKKTKKKIYIILFMFIVMLFLNVNNCYGSQNKLQTKIDEAKNGRGYLGYETVRRREQYLGFK